jgi:hypothetical protein
MLLSINENKREVFRKRFLVPHWTGFFSWFSTALLWWSPKYLEGFAIFFIVIAVVTIPKLAKYTFSELLGKQGLCMRFVNEFVYVKLMFLSKTKFPTCDRI